ncbi:MAG: hypothetical protein HUU35_08770 [Armatimonadetes bacterium]|nr:hypothetical protein [Armatimonadota bacterium]
MTREDRRLADLTQLLRERVGAAPGSVRCVRSPLRICPLGAHIDHQLGNVTGLTLNEALLLAYVPRADGVVRLWSLDFEGLVEFELKELSGPRPGDWGNYPRGAATILREEYQITRGFDGILSGPLPVGGLSSSAAVDVAYLLAFQDVNELEVDRRQNIRLAQRIENDYIGLNNGVLDQSIILESRSGALTHLDCLTMEFQHIPAPPGLRFDLVVAYSGVSHGLVGTGYNQRVAECAEAARRLLELAGEPPREQPRLRHVPVAALREHVDRLPEPLARRARHFAGEMMRVSEGLEAWRRGDLHGLGRLMTASGRSSIELYECGSSHLISLYEILTETPGVFGARFSGAGFRGSCVALADPDRREPIAASLATRYVERHPDMTESYSLHFCQPSGRAELVACRL